MRRWNAVVALASVALFCVLAGTAHAGKPTITRTAVDETFADEFLSEECGVPVETTVLGHQALRVYTDGGRLIEGFTVNVTLTATSAFGTFRFKDVGADLTRVTQDGIVHQIIGKLPFWFNGTFWEDPITEEPIKEPTGPDLFDSMLERACAALAP